MKFRPFLPATSLALASLVAVLLWNYRGSFTGLNSSDAPGFTISGRIASPGGAAMKDIQVRIRWQEDGVVRSVTVSVKEDGTFVADRLEPGAYTLNATAPPAEGQTVPRALGSADVTITDANVPGVVLRATSANR